MPRSQRAQSRQNSFQFALLNVVRFASQGENRRQHFQGFNPSGDQPYLVFDKIFRFHGFLPALLEIFLHMPLKVINIIEVGIIDGADRRLDVAGHRDIDQKHRSVPTRPQRLLHVLGGDQIGRGAR